MRWVERGLQGTPNSKSSESYPVTQTIRRKYVHPGKDKHVRNKPASLLLFQHPMFSPVSIIFLLFQFTISSRFPQSISHSFPLSPRDHPFSFSLSYHPVCHSLHCYCLRLAIPSFLSGVHLFSPFVIKFFLSRVSSFLSFLSVLSSCSWPISSQGMWNSKPFAT